MKPDCDNLRPALDAIARGEFDRLSADDAAAVEAHLAVCDPCTARLAAAAPDADPIRAALALPQAPGPDEWNRVWRAVEEDDAATRLRLRRMKNGWVLSAFAAAAVLVGAVGAWRVVFDTGRAWTPRVGGLAEVLELEVFDDGTPMVYRAGEDSGVSVIWVMDSEGVKT